MATIDTATHLEATRELWAWVSAQLLDAHNAHAIALATGDFCLCDAHMARAQAFNDIQGEIVRLGRQYEEREHLGTLPTAAPLSCWSCGRTEDASEPSEDRCAVCGCKQ